MTAPWLRTGPAGGPTLGYRLAGAGKRPQPLSRGAAGNHDLALQPEERQHPLDVAAGGPAGGAPVLHRAVLEGVGGQGDALAEAMQHVLRSRSLASIQDLVYDRFGGG
ncbi:hypothetical protein GCM10010404_71140 [Nonomuraea africana]